MGAVTNSVKHMKNGIVGMASVKISAQAGAITRLASNVSSTVNFGSKTCPVISECRNVG